METKKGNTVQGIYIDLDCILDTRLGTCSRLLNGHVEKIIASGYHTRDKDIFLGIDKNVFDEMYEKRDVVTLTLSKMTNIVKVLNKMIKELVAITGTQPIYNSVELYINFYPYKLDRDEIELIILCMKHWTDILIPIRFINKSNEELTPTWIENNIDTMFKYDYEQWLTAQTLNGNLNKKQLPEVHLIAPAIYRIDKEIKEDDIAHAIKDINDPNIVTCFNAVEKMATPLIDLNLIDIKYFSIIDIETTVSVL